MDDIGIEHQTFLGLPRSTSSTWSLSSEAATSP
jgi:hypothetical protein